MSFSRFQKVETGSHHLAVLTTSNGCFKLYCVWKIFNLSGLVSTPVWLSDLCCIGFVYFDFDLIDFVFDNFDDSENLVFDLQQVSLSPWQPTRIWEIWQPRPNVI